MYHTRATVRNQKRYCTDLLYERCSLVASKVIKNFFKKDIAFDFKGITSCYAHLVNVAEKDM